MADELELDFDPATAFSLAGHVALITGGSRGLGRAIAVAFARAGADVVIASRKYEACATLAEVIERETGRIALPYGVHVGHWDELDGLVDASYERFGKVDVLVNNAGMSPLFDDLVTISEEFFDKVIGVNMKGPFRLSSLVGTRMAAGSGGSIINISSTGAVHPRPEIAPYAAAKAGLNALTIAFARAFAPKVRCNAIMPGPFMTDVAASWDKSTFDARAKSFMLQRGGQPPEIVGAALYLASEASTYTTGSVITVDGGHP